MTRTALVQGGAGIPTDTLEFKRDPVVLIG